MDRSGPRFSDRGLSVFYFALKLSCLSSFWGPDRSEMACGCKSACTFDPVSAPIRRVSYWSLVSRWVNSRRCFTIRQLWVASGPSELYHFKGRFRGQSGRSNR